MSKDKKQLPDETTIKDAVRIYTLRAIQDKRKEDARNEALKKMKGDDDGNP